MVATPWRWAVMEVKNDGRKNIGGGGGVWHLAKGQHTQWDAWWMRAQRNRRSQMTFTAIKTFTWAPVWQQTDNQLPEFRDIREKRQKRECWAIQSRQMTFFWINALLRRVCLVFCRFKLISVQQSQSHAFPTHTYTHNDSKSSWTSVQKWLSPFSNPARKLSVHSHTHASLSVT